MLDPQQIDHIRITQRLFDIPSHPNIRSERLKRLRHQRRRTTQRDLRSQLGQRPDIRASHPAVEDIPQNRHIQPIHPTLLFPDRENIQQPLGRMLMRSVAGIQHMRPQKTRQEMRRPTGTVPQNDDVSIERLKIPSGILERFPLLQRTGFRREIDDIGTEAQSRQFKTNPRTGARFDKEIDDRLAAQSRHLLDRPFSNGLELTGRIQHVNNLLRRETLQIEQVFAIPDHETEGADDSVAVSRRKTPSSTPPWEQRTCTD